jgi:general secretion pathway protein E
MGVQDYLLTSSVLAIQAQRLVRRLCTQCREAYTPIEEVTRRWQLQRFTDGEEPVLYRPVGCSACGDTGYSGRIAILEILEMSDEIRTLVLQHADAGDIARCAREQGMVPMCDDGLSKAVRGVTTIDEVLRVVPESRAPSGST